MIRKQFLPREGQVAGRIWEAVGAEAPSAVARLCWDSVGEQGEAVEVEWAEEAGASRTGKRDYSLRTGIKGFGE